MNFHSAEHPPVPKETGQKIGVGGGRYKKYGVRVVGNEKLVSILRVGVLGGQRFIFQRSTELSVNFIKKKLSKKRVSVWTTNFSLKKSVAWEGVGC